MFENIIHYKCGCSNSVYKMTNGQTKEVKSFETKKSKCPICDTYIKVQKKERLTIYNNKITKEVI